MNRTKTAIAAGLLLLVAIPAVAAEPAPPPTDTAATAAATNPEPAAVPVTPSSAATLLDNLIDLMVRKGVLSTADVGTLKSAPADRQLADLIALLKQKGVVTDTEVAALPPGTATTPQAATASSTLTASVQSPVAGTAMPQAASPTKPEAPKVVTAIAPIRVLPLDPPKREGLIPDLKLGAVRLKPYGFFKTSVIYDTSQPRGIDFPLPQFLFGDTGPDASPEFHVKARSFRIGSNFEWVDIAPELTLTGRFEMDFEGNFTRVDNRNISAIRSSQPSIRLAWTRLDYRFSPSSSFFALFGQDWTPFGSSTLPNLVETTGLGIAFGTLYERAPQARFGFVQGIGGSGRGFKISPEIAVVLPGSGNPPSGTSFVIPTTPATPNVGLGVDTQLAIGERQGVDSARPEVEARVVAQFQLDKAPAVPAAQLIVSGVQGEREALVRNSDIALPTGTGANFRTLFPRGTRVGSERYGVSAEAQLPTRWFTLLAKYYRGADLRFFFAGQLFSFFNDTTGLTGTQTVPSIDGSAAVVLGLRGGVPTVAPQRPVRSAGGFVNLGFPISRWFNADPAGHNAGWSLYLHYGLDEAVARDVRRASPGGARWKSDLISANLQYKLNNWVTFAYEQSGYRTFALPSVTTGVFPLFRGVPTRLAIDRRSEFATIFTF